MWGKKLAKIRGQSTKNSFDLHNFCAKPTAAPPLYLKSRRFFDHHKTIEKSTEKMKYTTLLSLVAAQVQRPGPCPKVPDQPDFDVEKYLGVWFTFMTNDFINVPTNSECVAATYGFKNDNAITGKAAFKLGNINLFQSIIRKF